MPVMAIRLSKLITPLLAIAVISCGKEPVPAPVPVTELSESEILAMVRTDVQNTAYYKDIFLDGGCELNPGIKQNGKVINGRLPYALDKANIKEREYFLATVNDVSEGWTEGDRQIQKNLISGNPDDINGVLLYPDGEPRFRMFYSFGGHSDPHGSTLYNSGRANVKTFYENGGSFVGSCAGAFLAGAYANGRTRNYFNIWEGGNMISTGVSSSSIDMHMESDVFASYFGPGKGSTISGIRHNGGGYMDTRDAPAGTEIIAIFKNEAGQNSSSRKFYDQPSVWAYKASPASGRLVVTGSHPEDAPSGNILNLTASMFGYAWDGSENAKIKGVLANGDLFPIEPGIGDLQCHHFVLCPGADVSSLSLSVSYQGDYDMELYLKKDSFAFPDAEPDYSSTASADGKVTLTTGPLEKGLWYVTVRCATTVESKEIIIDPEAGLGRYFEYSGPIGVLNGVPYSIKAEWTY